jgi:hypothetical protein
MTIFNDNINPESFIGLVQNAQKKKGLKRRILNVIDGSDVIVAAFFTVMICAATITSGTIHKTQKDQLRFVAALMQQQA